MQSLEIGWSGYGVTSTVIKKMCSFKCDWIYKLATVRMMCVNISGQFVCETTKTGIFDFHHRWSLSFTLIFSVKLRLCPVLLHSDVPDSRVGLLCCQVRPYKEAANLRVNRCEQLCSMINKALKSASSLNISIFEPQVLNLCCESCMCLNKVSAAFR